MSEYKCARTIAVFLSAAALFVMTITAHPQGSDVGELVRFGKQAFNSRNYSEAEQYLRRALEKSETAQILGDLADAITRKSYAKMLRNRDDR